MVGFESYLNDFLILRAGYSIDTDDSRELVTGERASKALNSLLSYAYQGNSQNSGDYRHSVDLEIPF